MEERKLKILLWIVITVCMTIGGIMGIYIIGNETGVYDFDLIGAIFFGVIGGFLVYLMISKLNGKRNGKVPDVDERTVRIMQKFLLFSLYGVLIGSGAMLIIAYAMGIKTIETGILILCLLGIYMIISLGALVVKRL